MYQIIEVPKDAAEATEQLGTKAKFWFATEHGRFLFKEGRPGTGEDWAEKVACEICELLRLPHASYEFATYRGRPGVVTPMLVPEGGRLILGNEMLARLDRGYQGTRIYRQSQHTVGRVMGLLRNSNVRLPVGLPEDPRLRTSADLFCGYLMLDALIGNTDRHHENWGLIIHPGQLVELAPTFDHASSLGRNESDSNREARISGRDTARSVATYVARARSALYGLQTDAKPLLTIDAFLEAAKFQPSAANYWLERLEGVMFNDIEGVLSNVPSSRMSVLAKRFALEILKINKMSLLRRGGGAS